MSDFTERAEAEAERRMVARREQVGLMVHEQQRYIEGFGDGVRWAMADPTADEIEDIGQSDDAVTEWTELDMARAVIAYFLAARRGSE